ncbi:YwmB family TATA-box binding protein [[Clostridium] polysaccharolyticum]|uniref:TATA-box binding n=1 Tax=[Clostridium] polysaccharolyticum TaxID=29364 RepID=A0A1I0BRB3_9FIRM|nr:YwmB family TATA-box binding protein [[Clostridium] polysaccharolyticum]SET09589.1 TATA-box binding [[Clostridium] polysaccharolyticum]
MSKKIRTTIYIVGILWIVVMSQLLVNRIFKKDTNIMDAFIDTDTNIEESKLNLAVDYGTGSILSDQKEEVLRSLAQEINLRNYKIVTETGKHTIDMKIEKYTKKSKNVIEFISVEMQEGKENGYHHFVLLETKMTDDFSDVMKAKKDIEKYVSSWGAKDYQCVVKFTGNYKGQMSEKERNRQVEKLLRSLQAKRVDSIQADNYYAVYGYTNMVKDYIKASGKRININVVVTYNEQEDKTKLCLATPVLNEDY